MKRALKILVATIVVVPCFVIDVSGVFGNSNFMFKVLSWVCQKGSEFHAVGEVPMGDEDPFPLGSSNDLNTAKKFVDDYLAKTEGHFIAWVEDRHGNVMYDPRSAPS